MIDAKTCNQRRTRENGHGRYVFGRGLSAHSCRKSQYGCWTAFVLTLMEAWFPSVM